jgi:hypothetical protein
MSYMKNKYIILVSFCITLFGCTTQRKASKYLDRNPIFAAKECAVRFPIKETIDTITIQDNELLEAYEKEFTYLYSILDSVLGQQIPDSIKEKIVTVIQEKQVPIIEYKYIIKTQESTAKLQVLKDSCTAKIDKLNKDHAAFKDKLLSTENKLNVVSAKYENVKKERNKLYWWLILLLIALFRRPIFKGIKRLVTKF